jgi:hypothetical protein
MTTDAVSFASGLKSLFGFANWMRGKSLTRRPLVQTSPVYDRSEVRSQTQESQGLVAGKSETRRASERPSRNRGSSTLDADVIRRRC